MGAAPEQGRADAVSGSACVLFAGLMSPRRHAVYYIIEQTGLKLKCAAVKNTIIICLFSGRAGQLPRGPTPGAARPDSWGRNAPHPQRVVPSEVGRDLAGGILF